MTKPFDDLMRQLGIPVPWDRVVAFWGLVGSCEATKHNLMVLTTSTDLTQRQAAAQEIAFAIFATAAALLR